MSPRTAEHMTWHQAHHAVDGVMVHPSNSEAWKRFNSVHPHFSQSNVNKFITHTTLHLERIDQEWNGCPF